MKRYRLTENKLRGMIHMAVRNVLNEGRFRYKGFTVANISKDPSFPMYGIFSPEGEQIETTMFPSELKEIVDAYLSGELKENKIRGFISEAVRSALYEVYDVPGFTNTQVRNMLGIYDDDELNAAVEYEDREELMSQVWDVIDRLAGNRQEKYPMEVNFRELCDALERNFGFTYDYADTDNDSYVFTDEQGDELWLAVDWAYARPGETIAITNMGIN